jgi:hypothetical protein
VQFTKNLDKYLLYPVAEVEGMLAKFFDVSA